jgi:hypothetical protein
MLDNTSLADEWNYLAEKASQEQDPKRLLELINGLCDILDMEGPAATSFQAFTKY